jgi:hypothetical protein
MEVLLQISGTLYIYFVNICCFFSREVATVFGGFSLHALRSTQEHGAQRR